MMKWQLLGSGFGTNSHFDDDGNSLSLSLHKAKTKPLSDQLTLLQALLFVVTKEENAIRPCHFISFATTMTCNASVTSQTRNVLT
jgi:hypothetical protein